MNVGYKKKPLVIVVFSFLYLLFPIVNLSVLLFYQNTNGIFRNLFQLCSINPGFLIINLILWLSAFPLCYGLFKVKLWAWFYFIVHGSLIILFSLFQFVNNNLRLMINPIFFFNLLVIIPMAVFIRRKIRNPYLNPQLKWWEQAKRVKHNVNIIIKNEEYETFDISESGAFIIDPNRMITSKPGDILPISISFEDYILKCYSEVIWVNQETERKLPQGVGIKFLNLETSEEKNLKFFIDTMLK